MGAVAAAGVGYLTTINPRATPAEIAVTGRVLIIGTLIVTGVYAQTSRIQARMGGLLVAAGLWSSLWLSNGSSNPLAFSVGVLCTGLTPAVFSYLMLAHPSGRLHSTTERRFLATAGGALTLLWVVAVLTSIQPPLATPLLRCAPHCPHNAFFIGSATAEVQSVLKGAIMLGWIAVVCGTPLLLAQRWRAASAPLRRSLSLVVLVATATAVFLGGYFAGRIFGLHLGTTFGVAYVELAVALPVAILVGLSLERLFMGRTLADFVSELSHAPRADPQSLIADALCDPSLQIAYRRPATGTYVDASGARVTVPQPGHEHAVTWIESDTRPLAAVIYDPELSDQERFVQAAGAAAMMRLEQTQLEADLKASTADLAASRIRLVESAHAERRRIERDLHDGVQQDLVGLRIKLELAVEALKEEPARGERMLAAVGRQMDDTLEALRSLARGIYPALLQERGVAEALTSAARRLPLPIAVRASSLGRYHEDLEVAVYFCCLEALQNFVKHAGDGGEATVRLWQARTALCFEVSDTGIGFNPREIQPGNGLVNMRDRIEAVGGTLTVTSRRAHGTSVRGRIPIG